MLLKFEFDLNTALERENVSSEVLSEIRRVDFEGLSECISDHQLLLFFVAYKRDMEKTRNAIKNYFKYKKNFTHFFLNRDPKCDDIQQCLENQYNFFLPVTPLKMSVVYAAFRNSDPSKFFHDNAIKTYLMVIDACLNVHGPKNGLILLFDCKNSKIGHLKRVNVKSISFICNFLQKCLPVKLEEIHILNPPFYLETVLALCRPFMKHDRKLFVHTPTNDYSKLFNGKIPPDCLPSDFGGSLDSIEELHKKNTELLMKMRHYFTDEEKKL